jgi:hypothetical protein
MIATSNLVQDMLTQGHKTCLQHIQGRRETMDVQRKGYCPPTKLDGCRLS